MFDNTHYHTPTGISYVVYEQYPQLLVLVLLSEVII